MSWPAAIVLIVMIAAVAKVLAARYRAQAGIIADKQGNESYIERSDDASQKAAEKEVEELRERVKVLERIAYDANSAEARNSETVAKEIENLRDK